ECPGDRSLDREAGATAGRSRRLSARSTSRRVSMSGYYWSAHWLFWILLDTFLSVYERRWPDGTGGGRGRPGKRHRSGARRPRMGRDDRRAVRAGQSTFLLV